jgi:hypothetical protein
MYLAFVVVLIGGCSHTFTLANSIIQQPVTVGQSLSFIGKDKTSTAKHFSGCQNIKFPTQANLTKKLQI